MKSLKAVIALLILLGLVSLVVRARSSALSKNEVATLDNTAPSELPTSQPAANKTCVPTFVDGGGPYYQPNAPFRAAISPPDAEGTKLSVRGRVLSADCVTPLKDVIVDIWQADALGNYDTEWYRGRIRTNQDGEYSFETVLPLGYQEGTSYRPPHIHFKIWQGDTELITSQMFLPAAREQNIEDAYIMKLGKIVYGADIEEAKDTPADEYQGVHDIVVP